MERRLDAVIYAGGLITGPLAQASGETVKALIRLGGRPTIACVVDALANADRVGRIAVVGGQRLKLHLPRSRSLLFVEEGRGAVENILRGLKALGALSSETQALVCPGDLPLITPASVDALIASAPTTAALTIGLTERRVIRETYPNAPYSYLRAREGRFSNASPVVIRAELVQRFQQVLEEFTHSRKSQLRLASKLGIPSLLRYVLGRLTLAEAETIGAKLFGAPVKLVSDAYPELTMDIDDVPEYLYLLKQWSSLAPMAARAPAYSSGNI